MVPSISIGSTVRIKSRVIVSRPKRSDITLTIARRALVATSPDNNGNVSLVVDDLVPTPLQSGNKFIIAPVFNSKGEEDEEVEVPVTDLILLLDFEKEDAPSNNNTNADINTKVQQYKDYGDQLLRLNDYTCAISYYEVALNLVSTKVDIGGTIVVNKEGHAVIAEVDYVEEGNYDITLPSGDESTITQKDVLLVVWLKDCAFLQVKILLNLCRCLLKLADIDTRAHAIWAKQAVKGCSIALTLCEYHASESSNEKTTSELTSLIEKTRIVRARAFIKSSKLKNATIDAKKVLAINSTNREAQSILSEIKVVDHYNKSLDKKISKEVCRWVQTATSSAEGSSAMDRMNDSVSEEPEQGKETVNKDKRNDDEKNGKPALEVEDKRIVMSQLCGTVVLVVALLIGIWDMNTRKVGKNYPV